ncbi:hypothetical protein FS749_006280 [Ceratobasidium sp. UAMH 11750]|nr:hypothetical protein FS749_006280 [Ceratobasidium sp. UAMH 11750]
MARRDKLTDSKDPSEQWKAYNTAVQEELEAMHSNSPAQLQELEDLVDEVRATAMLPFAEQSPEVQEAVLNAFPALVASMISEWERRTGARIYLLSCWTGPSGAPSKFDYASKNCKQFLNTEDCERVQEIWQDWISEELGGVLTRNPELARPAIWPNKHGWPMFPDIKGMGLLMKDELRLARRYLTCLSLAYGGTQPSYTRIEESMKQNPGHAIDPARMPRGVATLRDPRHWKRPKRNAWIDRFCSGQDGGLPEPEVFAYRVLPQLPSAHEIIIDEIRTTPVAGVRIPWTAEELLFGEKMTLETTDATADNRQEQQLPLARTNHIYAPYSIDLYDALESIHAEEAWMMDLFNEVACMEDEGPIHNGIGFSDNPDNANPHVPHSSLPSLARQLSPASWLPAATFNARDAGYPVWSPDTLKTWINMKKPHIHPGTNTVYAGPLGIRVLAFAISRVVQNINCMAAKKGIPAELGILMRRGKHGWLNRAGLAVCREMVDILRRDIARSRVTLVATLKDRTEGWKREIMLTRQQYEESRTDDKDIGPSATSGVPRSRALRLAMLTELEQPGHGDDDDVDFEIAEYEHS